MGQMTITIELAAVQPKTVAPRQCNHAKRYWVSLAGGLTWCGHCGSYRKFGENWNRPYCSKKLSAAQKHVIENYTHS